MQKNGFQPLDFSRSSLKEEDILVIPKFNTNTIEPSPEFVVPLARIELEGCRWLAVMNPPSEAGFYSDRFGPFPFIIAWVPPEMYLILQQKK